MSECCDSISDLESAFHHGFMRTRIKTGDFVYLDNERLARELDTFCDVDSMGQPKGPIILLGHSGVGKSAFLANWLVRRKKMFQNWQSSYPEFIFYHVVGCTRQSCSVPILLERILREIKDYFELNKEIPEVAERLSWQFPRFLEAASKKGRVVLIIDGLQRLRTSDGENILKWVPLVFPPNVRLIFAATMHAFGKHSDHLGDQKDEKNHVTHQMMERIRVEATRRNWVQLHLHPLHIDDRRRIIARFLLKHHPHRSSHGAIASNISPTNHTNNNSNKKAIQPDHQGFLLFHLQQNAIAGLHLTTSPMIIKILLCCLLWAANEDFNIHRVLEDWLVSESASHLFEVILRTMETGYTPDQASIEDARVFIMENKLHVTPMGQKKRHSFSSLKRKTGRTRLDGLVVDSDGHPHMIHEGRDVQEIPAETDLHFEEVQPQERPSSPTSSTRRPRSAANSARPTSSSSSSSPPRTIKDENDPKERVGDTIHEASSCPTPSSAQGSTRCGSDHQEIFLTRLPDIGSNDPSQEVKPSSSPAGNSSSFRSPPRHQQMEVAGHTDGEISPSGLKTTSSMIVSAQVEFPPYLTGGRPVQGLGKLIGKALALLYVCRHGLLVNELNLILNALMVHERELRQMQENPSQFHDQLAMPFDGSSPNQPNQKEAFSDGQWRYLLRCLRALGILFVQDVLILPLCEETLREVVWWRYIGSEKEEIRFHQWLIRFFHFHPITFRRVEELPWHLERCFEWEALRDVLVNLRMFELAYTANFKNELFQYWKLLIDGPLIVYDPDDDLGKTPSVLPSFDIVKEYSKSSEDWYRTQHPSTKSFTPMLVLIANFMYEFCISYHGQGVLMPTFCHAPLDMKKLWNDGFQFVGDLPHMQSGNQNQTQTQTLTPQPQQHHHQQQQQQQLTANVSAVQSTASPTAVASTPDVLTTLAPAVDLPNHFFFYLRWIWIHFPWLALHREILTPENKVVSSGSAPTRSLPSSNRPDSCVVDSGSVTKPVEAACANEDSGNGNSGTTTVHADDHPSFQCSINFGGDDEKKDNANASGVQRLRLSQVDIRLFDVKRGLNESKMTMSPAKVKSLQRSSTLASMASIPPTEKLIAPNHLYEKKNTFATVKKVMASSVRSLPHAVAAMRASSGSLHHVGDCSGPNAATRGHTGPCDSPDTRLVGSTTPGTAVAAVAAVAAVTTSTPPPADAAAVPTTTAAGSTPPTPVAAPTGASTPLPNPSSTSSPICTGMTPTSPSATTMHKMSFLSSMDTFTKDHMLSTSFGLPAHFQDYPKSEWELKSSGGYDLLLRLQTMYDQLKAEAKQKKQYLALLRQRSKDTRLRYEKSMREKEQASAALDAMALRSSRFETLVESIDRQDKNHRRLLKALDLFPHCDLVHFETIKKQSRLVQMQQKDLACQKKTLLQKKTHLLTVEKPTLDKEMTKTKVLLDQVILKLEDAKTKLLQNQTMSQLLYERRLEMMQSLQADNRKDKDLTSGKKQTEDHGSPTQKDKYNKQHHGTNNSSRSLAARIALQQCESICEKIQSATGYSKLDAILQKFTMNDELLRSFDEQVKVYESRLKQMKIHEAELAQQIHSLELCNATRSNDDPRTLEDKLRLEEMDLAKAERHHNALLTDSKDIVGGASRIVQLLGITSCHPPYQFTFLAKDLWPPPLGFERDATLASEFEMLQPKEISSLLQLCQDRACAMMDVTEGGHGDPDNNFIKRVASRQSRLRQQSGKRSGEKSFRRPLSSSASLERQDQAAASSNVASLDFSKTRDPGRTDTSADSQRTGSASVLDEGSDEQDEDDDNTGGLSDQDQEGDEDEEADAEEEVEEEDDQDTFENEQQEARMTKHGFVNSGNLLTRESIKAAAARTKMQRRRRPTSIAVNSHCIDAEDD